MLLRAVDVGVTGGADAMRLRMVAFTALQGSNQTIPSISDGATP